MAPVEFVPNDTAVSVTMTSLEWGVISAALVVAHTHMDELAQLSRDVDGTPLDAMIVQKLAQEPYAVLLESHAERGICTMKLAERLARHCQA